jgi:hypothetical protein
MNWPGGHWGKGQVGITRQRGSYTPNHNRCGGGGGGFGRDGSVTMLFPSHPSRARQAAADPVLLQPAPR